MDKRVEIIKNATDAFEKAVAGNEAVTIPLDTLISLMRSVETLSEAVIQLGGELPEMDLETRVNTKTRKTPKPGVEFSLDTQMQNRGEE